MICCEIGEVTQIGDQELWLCENWNCWYAHLKHTTSLLLQVYVKQHQAMLKRRGRTGGSSYNPTLYRHSNYSLIDQLSKKRRVQAETESLKDRLKYEQNNESSGEEGIYLPDDATASCNTSSHSQASVHTLDHFNSDTIQLSLSLSPPTSEKDIEDFIRYHFKHYGPRVTPIGLFFSLNFCHLGYNLDPQNVKMNKYKFYNYFKTLDESVRYEIRHRFNLWIKHNKHMVERIRNEMQRYDRWEDIDEDVRIHGRDDRWEILNKSLEGNRVEKISEIKNLLESKLDR
jgi:hypothetical protein